MKEKIKQIVLNNSVNADIGVDMIFSQDFEKLIDELNDLFALGEVGKPLFEFVEHGVVRHRISAKNKKQAYKIMREIYDKDFVWEGYLGNKEVNVIVK